MFKNILIDRADPGGIRRKDRGLPDGERTAEGCVFNEAVENLFPYLTSLGITFSPHIVNAVATLFGNNGVTSGFLAAAAIEAVIVVVELIYETVFNKDSQIGK